MHSKQPRRNAAAFAGVVFCLPFPAEDLNHPAFWRFFVASCSLFWYTNFGQMQGPSHQALRIRRTIMVFSIGIISAKSSLSHIQSSLSSRDSATYQFHYFPYSSVDEVPQIYKEHEHDCDGFVFSGALPYYQLLRHYSKLRVPCTYIDVTQRDYLPHPASGHISEPPSGHSPHLVGSPGSGYPLGIYFWHAGCTSPDAAGSLH